MLLCWPWFLNKIVIKSILIVEFYLQQERGEETSSEDEEEEAGDKEKSKSSSESESDSEGEEEVRYFNSDYLILPKMYFTKLFYGILNIYLNTIHLQFFIMY